MTQHKPHGQVVVSKRATLVERFFGLFRGRNARINPRRTAGAPGFANYNGFIVENEADPTLTGRERYLVFSRILANTSIASAGVRYYTDLISKASWSFVPAEHPRGEELAALSETMITEDPDTTWARIVRRAAMYRFYGFSIQEWTAKRRADGLITFADIAPRAQITIERWITEEDGSVAGVVQRSPQTQQEIPLPRGKLLYLVDDTLSDTPMGLGLFRHLVGPARRLARYEQLEGYGFETDLRGVPVGRAPYGELREQQQSGQIKAKDAKAAVAPIEHFVTKTVRSPDAGVPGVVIDSAVYESEDGASAPSTNRKYDVELLQGSSSGLPDIARSIERVNREIARILGVEAILLGDGDRGSHALARDKTQQLSLTIDATLGELADAFEKDLLRPLFQLNGWPVEAMPKMRPEAVQYRDVQQLATALRDLATAGAMLDPDDPVIAEVRALLGLSPPDLAASDLDASLRGNTPTDNPDDEDVPERQRDEEEPA